MTGEHEATRDELVDQRAVLAEFGRVALKTDNLQDILQEACRLVGRGLRVDLAKIMELQPDGANLLVRAGVGWEDGIVGRLTIPVEPRSSEMQAIQTGEPFVCDDVEGEQHFTIPDFLRDHGVRSLVNVPILGSGAKPPYGILQVDSRRPRAFTQSDIDFLRGYANLLASSIERLNLLPKLEAAVEEKQRLFQELQHQMEIDRQVTTRFRALVEANSEVMYRMSADWSEMRHLSGGGFLSDTEEPNRRWFEDYIPPEEQPRVMAAIQEAIQTKGTFELEHRVRSVGGALGWTHSRAVPVLDAHGAIVEWFGVASDVSARKEAEEALRRSEERLRRAFKTETVGMIFFDPAGTIKEANEAFLGFSGFTREDVAAGRLQWQELTPPEHMAASWRAFTELTTTGRATPYEKEYFRKDGSRWWGLFAPRLLEDGEAVEFILEITERKLAEFRQAYRLMLNEQLRDVADPHAMMDAATAALGSLLGVAQVGYCEINEAQTHGTIHRHWNDGRMPSVVGTYHLDDYGPAFIAEVKRGETVAIADVRQDPRTCAPEVVAAHERIAIRSRLIVPLVKGGRLVAALFIHHPEPRAWVPTEVALVEETGERLWAAVERARAEARLRQSEERFRLMADAVPAIVWLTDAEGRVEFFNKQWSNYTGVPYEPTTATEVAATFLHPDDTALTTARFEEARRTGNTYLAEHRIRSKDGEYRWFLVRGEPYRDPHTGAIIRWFGASVDIHDRKCAEAALRAARDKAHEARNAAEAANQSKSKFLAAASHDLRQPMQSLLLFLEILGPHVAPKGREALKHLGRGLDAMRDLLDSLLDISRLDAGIVEPVIADFAVQDFVEQIGAAYTPIAAAKGIAFQAHPCPAVVHSDRTLLGRMVRNLVENALRYTETGRIAVACHRTEDRLRIEVHDTGIGIPPEHLTRIWEEFHQVGNPERDRNRGLGLGLAIVQRLSLLLKHPVDVRSTPGQGSVFAIEVPLGRAEPRQATVSAAEVAGNGRLAVLVDDDAIVLVGLKAMFEAWGYTVLAAGSTDRALDALKANGGRPDIVVADYRLRGGRNGTEAILGVREAYGGAVPGIILTGETGSEVQHEAAAHGLHVVHKPVTPRQLGEALERLLTGGRCLPTV